MLVIFRTLRCGRLCTLSNVAAFLLKQSRTGQCERREPLEEKIRVGCFSHRVPRGGTSDSNIVVRDLPTGETDQAKAKQLATAERERIIKQVDAEREAGRRPMTVAHAFQRYKESVTLGTPTEATATRKLAWLQSQLGSNKSVGEITQSDITNIKRARRSMTTISGAGEDNQGRPLERLVSASTVNRTLQWLRAALYHVRDHHEAFLRPLKFSLTTEPQRVREATPEEEGVLIRHLRDDYHPISLYGIVSGIRETGLCTLEWPRVDFRNRRSHS